MHTLQQVVYTGTATATGGREGTAKSSDGKLELGLSTPKELGGAGGQGTNPEQMFAAGYSACFIGALKHVAASQKIKLSDDISVTGDIKQGWVYFYFFPFFRGVLYLVPYAEKIRHQNQGS